MSPSSLPPRLRDTRALEDLVRQEKVNLRQLGVGFAGGRFSPLRPRSTNLDMLGEDDEDYDTDPEIAFSNTDQKVASGPGIQPPFRLTHTPLDGSLHVYWNGLAQPPTEWTLTDNVVTIPDTQGFVRAGDVFSAAYAYIDDFQQPDVIDFAYVSHTAFDNGSSSGAFTSLAMPAGAQAGDMVLLTTIGGWDVSGRTGYNHPVPDPRFTEVWNGAFCTRTCRINYAVLGSDLSAIQIDVKGDPSAIGQFIGVMATIWRPTLTPGSLVLDGRVAATPDDGTPVIQGLDGGGSGAFAVIFDCAGFGGVQQPSSLGSPWTGITSCGVYAGMLVASTTNGAPPASTFVRTDPDDGYMAVTVGIGFG